MLSPDEQREIEADAAHYPQRRAVAIDALAIVQRHRGFISDEAMNDLAAFLGLSASELEGLTTFYNLLHRRPVGRHVIYICDGVSCWLAGYRRLLADVETQLGIRLGETTPDERFTLLPIVCLGACDRAPVLLVDGDLQAGSRAADALAAYT